MPPRVDMIGFKTNELTVVKRGSGLANGKTCWVCECSCGKWTIVAVDKLRNGHTKSCGCFNTKARKARVAKMSLINTKYPDMNRLDWKKYQQYKNVVKSEYGITEIQIQKLMDKQQGCCDICKRSLDYLGKKFCIDHDHKTGEVRGLLCHNCNIAIGNMQDNPTYLRSAAAYLEKYNE